jgi:hypothetical protein
MAISATTPIIKDGISYPYFTVNLAVSPNIQGNDIGGSVALRLTPYRVLEDGNLEFCESDTKAVAYGDVFQNIAQGDADLGNVVSGIMGKIQEFILSKGL